MSQSLLDLLLPPSPEASDRFYGVVPGLVTNNKDPDGLGRVKVCFPWLSEQSESAWARVATLMAGKERGIYFLPEVDDEVLVAFEHGDMNYPYVLGALWNGQDKPIESNADGKNNKQTIKSRSGLMVRLDDTEGSEQIEISDREGKNYIKIQVADNKITIAADAEIAIKSSNGKLKLSGNGIEITSQAEIKIEASQNMDLKAGPQLNIKGSMVNIN